MSFQAKGKYRSLQVHANAKASWLALVVPQLRPPDSPAASQGGAVMAKWLGQSKPCTVYLHAHAYNHQPNLDLTAIPVQGSECHGVTTC